MCFVCVLNRFEWQGRDSPWLAYTEQARMTVIQLIHRFKKTDLDVDFGAIATQVL